MNTLHDIWHGPEFGWLAVSQPQTPTFNVVDEFLTTQPAAEPFGTSRLCGNVGARLPAKKRELFFVLPKRAQNLDAYFDPFIEGMFWRDPAAFTEGTRAVINRYLNAGVAAWERVVDALAAVSTKPKHPYHAQRLYEFLARFPMPDRDLQWSEYLRRRYASPTIHRLLTWAQKLNAANMTAQSAKELVILLSLVLTTVNRADRDIATKALVLIGERFPDVLFSHLETSLAFNDPYLPEQMLAAAYGTTLSLVDSEHAETFRPVLGQLAKTLYRKMFAPGATNRDLFAFLRGLFIARKDVQALRSKFLAIEYPGNDAIPEAATETYLYAGEAGRRKNYVRRLRQLNGTYRRQTEEAFDSYERVYTKRNTPAQALTIKFVSSAGVESEHSLARLLEPTYEMRRVPGIRIEVPSIQFGWESYHSTQNKFSGFDLPAPKLIQRLGLASKNREIDFYDAEGNPGSLYREAGDGWKGDRHSLLYVRADLLRRYAKATMSRYLFPAMLKTIRLLPTMLAFPY